VSVPLCGVPTMIHCIQDNSAFGISTSLFLWCNSSPKLHPPWARASSFARLQDHTQAYHTRYHSSGRVISPTWRPLPDNKQHSQATDIYEPSRIRTRNPTSKRPQTQALDGVATGISFCIT